MCLCWPLPTSYFLAFRPLYIKYLFKHAGDICCNVVDVTCWPVFATLSHKSAHEFFYTLGSQNTTIASSVSPLHSEVQVLILYYCYLVEQLAVLSADMEVLASYTSL
jgi:hypothetical protein